jgi:hypothetical protein
MPHPILNCAQWRTGAGHSGAKRVAQIMYADRTQTRSSCRSLKPFAHLGRIKNTAARRVAKDEVRFVSE